MCLWKTGFRGHDGAWPFEGTLWIPAFAGMTGEGGAFRFALPALQCCGFDHGACRGAAPFCVFSLPQERGAKTVEHGVHVRKHPGQVSDLTLI